MSFEDDVDHYADFLARRQRREMTEGDLSTVYSILNELRTNGRLLPEGGESRVEYGLHDTKMTRTPYPVFIGTNSWAEEHATHMRVRVVWPDYNLPNDAWSRYTSRWVEIGQAITDEINADPEEVVKLKLSRQQGREGKTIPLSELRSKADTLMSVLSVRVTEDESAAIRKWAKDRDISLSVAVRQAITLLMKERS